MKYVYKFKLKPGRNTVTLRKGWVPLSIQAQGVDACLWAIIDTRNEELLESIHLIGTGHELPQWASRTTYVRYLTSQGQECRLVFVES